MRDVVGRVDVMGTISASIIEQSSGVAQIEQAVNQMDEATQQNAALVEQSSAAADSLKDKARELVQAVAFFRTGTEPADAVDRRDRVAPAVRVDAHGEVSREWTTF